MGQPEIEIQTETDDLIIKLVNRVNLLTQVIQQMGENVLFQQERLKELQRENDIMRLQNCYWIKEERGQP